MHQMYRTFCKRSMGNRSYRFVISGANFCPNKAAALGNIVVSLTYTAYLWAALITF